jgi:hypothetical protein
MGLVKPPSNVRLRVVKMRHARSGSNRRAEDATTTRTWVYSANKSNYPLKAEGNVYLDSAVLRKKRDLFFKTMRK